MWCLDVITNRKKKFQIRESFYIKNTVQLNTKKIEKQWRKEEYVETIPRFIKEFYINNDDYSKKREPNQNLLKMKGPLRLRFLVQWFLE